MTMNALMRMGGSGGGEANGLMQLARGGGQPQPSQGGDVVGAVNRYLDQRNSQRTDAEIMQAIQAVTGYPISKQQFMDHIMGGKPLDAILREPPEGSGSSENDRLMAGAADRITSQWETAESPRPGRRVHDEVLNGRIPPRQSDQVFADTVQRKFERRGQSLGDVLAGPDWRYDTGPR